MVAPKPNETRLAGTVRAVRSSERRPEVVELVMAVDRADDVAGRANLLGDKLGEEVTVTTNAQEIADLGLRLGERVVVGAEVRGRHAVWSRPRTVRRGR